MKRITKARKKESDIPFLGVFVSGSGSLDGTWQSTKVWEGGAGSDTKKADCHVSFRSEEDHVRQLLY